MAFRDKTIGRECFMHLKGWSDASQDGDAVGIGFIDFGVEEYGLCVYQDSKRLIDRVLPKSHQNESEPYWIKGGYIKLFPKASQGYTWFKSMSKQSPFVLSPGTIDGELMLDLAICKSEVSFYQRDNIPDHTMESVLAKHYISGSDAENSLNLSPTPNLKLSPLEIFQRRKLQLARFFPVTLERLRFNPLFSKTKQKLLKEGYQEWQITQAACNIVLKYRLPELFAKTDHDQYNVMGIIDYLLTSSEDVSSTLPPDQELSIEQLIQQIKVDTYQLILYVIDDYPPYINNCDLQLVLLKYGLLEAPLSS